MERVAFLIERTGERIECLLNPDTFTFVRQAGVRPMRTLSGVLTGVAASDDSLLATGGGTTELTLELLFDVSRQSTPQPHASVQTLTAPLWNLAENSDDGDGGGHPPLVRFVWGKAWNVAAVVVSVAERFERFTPEGSPQRSWLKLRLVRASVPALVDAAPVPALAGDELEEWIESVPEDEVVVHEVVGELPADEDAPAEAERIEQLAHRFCGDVSRWPLLAAFNHIDDPTRLAPGMQLRVPPFGRATSR
jgi:hypothetical protein